MIVDGTNKILGRLGSMVAKKLMLGEKVHLINIEKLVISGAPKTIIKAYLERRRLQHKGTPEHSPKWSLNPTLLVRRIIRGMLPFKKAKGRAAFKKLRVYAGNPNLKGEITEFANVKNKGFKQYISIENLCKKLGAKR